MQCYVCVLGDTHTPAVAICDICSVGLCVEHLTENALRTGPGGMRPYGCLHRPGHDRPRSGLEVEDVQGAKPLTAGSKRRASRRGRAALKPSAAWLAADAPGAPSA